LDFFLNNVQLDVVTELYLLRKLVNVSQRLRLSTSRLKIFGGVVRYYWFWKCESVIAVEANHNLHATRKSVQFFDVTRIANCAWDIVCIIHDSR
ncbi:MAG: hypothetical protein OEV74_19450, partial [Cyclobacteriaceae bacterium]|nr:hypothetical protein [Cyclobacteriaceae bacterium]